MGWNITGGRLYRPRLVATGSPQRFGFRTVQDVLDFYLR